MLTSLYINNLAVIEKAYIDFDMGLNVFTGETGAGKSIVIDALNAILGQRATKEIVRNGEEKAVISGVFTKLTHDTIKKIEEYGFEVENDEIIIQREISSDGKSSARLCSRPITVSVLREIGSELINIHGQHDNQVLMSAEKHIDILDSCAGIDGILSEYKQCYAELKRIRKELAELHTDEAQKAQKIDLLSYQIEEIEAAELHVGEDEALESERKTIQNSTKIMDSLRAAYEALYGGESYDGAVDLVSGASQEISSASEFYEDITESAQRMEGLSYELQEIASEISGFLENFDYDPRKLDEIELRLDEIFKLKHKYGATIEDILEFLVHAQQELEKIERSDVSQKELSERLIVQQEKIKNISGKLSNQRRKAAREFVHLVSQELIFLDMPNVKLDVFFESCDFYSKGTDKIEFLISTNLGEPPKSIAKIASGGELSRIMLAIKNVMADKDAIPTLIFDEIDTGVSGRAAQKIGLKLKQVANNKQVICVTHSAQIAALAGTHLYISKQVENNRTFTKIDTLDFDGRKYELARIMGTDSITDLMLKNAEEMLIMAGNS
ncbi:MAG: repair protein RecN [Oscillospiraceae bacterium]|jgi:DNA repair protein RecN (Recombination protein N)|nr:repair protein RecN [Oscillospiraceae bacterium]